MKLGPVALSRGKAERYKHLGRVGKILSFTSIAVAPLELSKRVPYIVAVVDFGKEKATLQLCDVSADEVKIGMKVIGVLRRMYEPDEEEIIAYGVKCRPVGEHEQ